MTSLQELLKHTGAICCFAGRPNRFVLSSIIICWEIKANELRTPFKHILITRRLAAQCRHNRMTTHVVASCRWRMTYTDVWHGLWHARRGRSTLSLKYRAEIRPASDEVLLEDKWKIKGCILRPRRHGSIETALYAHGQFIVSEHPQCGHKVNLAMTGSHIVAMYRLPEVDHLIDWTRSCGKEVDVSVIIKKMAIFV